MGAKIKGCNYIIYKDGRVWSIKSNKFLKPHYDKDGYLYHRLYLGSRGHVKWVFLHRLIAEYFIPNPHNKPQVNHIDGNKTNNNINNLEWVTRSENIQHAYDTGLIKNMAGIIQGGINGGYTRGEQMRKPIIAINNITGEKLFFNSMTEINGKLGMSRTSILNRIKGIIKDERWSFEYVKSSKDQ